MNRNRYILIKGFLLLVVFSINTVVSFACSVSDFVHSSHHSTDKSVPAHSHQHGKHHGDHNHDQDKNKHNDGNSNSNSDKCCASIVVKIEQSDKSVSKNIDAPSPLFFSYTTIIFFSVFHLFSFATDKHFPQHLRWPPATIPDIRIAIQSFQI